MFTVAWVGKQAIDKPFVGVDIGVIDEVGNFCAA
jgi:hypothetical protein